MYAHVSLCSLPFPVDVDEGAAGDGDRPGPGPSPQVRKGLSREQMMGLEMVRQVMTSLGDEDSLDEVYTFRYLSCKPVSSRLGL